MDVLDTIRMQICLDPRFWAFEIGDKSVFPEVEVHFVKNVLTLPF